MAPENNPADDRQPDRDEYEDWYRARSMPPVQSSWAAYTPGGQFLCAHTREDHAWGYVMLTCQDISGGYDVEKLKLQGYRVMRAEVAPMAIALPDAKT